MDSRHTPLLVPFRCPVDRLKAVDKFLIDESNKMTRAMLEHSCSLHPTVALVVRAYQTEYLDVKSRLGVKMTAERWWKDNLGCPKALGWNCPDDCGGGE